MKYSVKNARILNVENLPCFDCGKPVTIGTIIRWAIENLAGFNVGGPAIVAQSRIDYALREGEEQILLETEDRDKLLSELEKSVGWNRQGELSQIPYPLVPSRLMLQVFAALREAELVPKRQT